MTDQTQRTIHVKWKRSGIGFTRRQRASVRGLGLRRLHHVVEREDTPQVRGLVAAVPHLVEIADGPLKPAPWAAIPEYTIHPKVETAEKKASAKRVEQAVQVAEAPVSEVHEPEPATKDSGPKRGRAPKAAKAASAKGKAAAVKEPAKKKAKAAEKPAKTKTSKGKK
ncbi:MAG: 50S ribosomal protein L30 [Acidobacteria bacterium]|nr:50S ribosomal protein L30 [Acidobacteriota bacterium]